MNRPDSTPLPLEITIPRPVDSSPGLTLEAKKEGRVRGSRGLMRSLVFPGVLVATLAGPHAHDAINNYQQEEAQDKIAMMRGQEVPRSLRSAQSTAQGELFGEGGEAHNNLQKFLKQASLDLRDTEWQLPAGQFVSPGQVKISEDGKSAEIGGQSYSFGGVRADGGHIYIMAARKVHEDKLLSDDRLHLVNPMLIGGAEYDKDMSREELKLKAYENARQNLKKSLEVFDDREFAKEPQLPKDALIAKK